MSESGAPGAFETTVREGVLRFRHGTTDPLRWLSTGTRGGFVDAPAAYNVTVPEGFDRTDLAAYARERRSAAGFESAGPSPGPTLLTGVEMRHARGARLGPVCAVVTAGLSNPAVLPMDPAGDGPDESRDGPPRPGTVNCLVGTTRSLDDGAAATLLSTVVEAKTATLLAETGFTGTTSDAVVVGSLPGGRSARFAGSATEVGAAARACVREALVASLASRYPAGDLPGSVAQATYGVSTDRRAATFTPDTKL